MTSPPRQGEKAAAAKIRLAFYAAFFLLGLFYLVRPFVSDSTVVFSPLWLYGATICALAALALLLDRADRSTAALVIFYFLFFDISLALLTRESARYGYSISLYPHKTPSVFSEPRFVSHPLLQIVPKAGYRDETFAHTPIGTRKVEARPEALGSDAIDVALVGGSSTYDVDLSQGETWADHLQRRLGGFRIWNFGAPGFSTAEHVIQTAMYLPAHGVECAVYYVGWNDVRNAFLPHLDPGYADFHLLAQASRIRVQADKGFTATLKLVTFLVSRASQKPRPPPYARTLPLRKGVDPALERIYRRNINSIIALNARHGIRTAFVAQVMNERALRAAGAGRRFAWIPALAERDVPEAIDRLNEVLREEARRSGVPFLEVDRQAFAEEDFGDRVHFSASGAARFADQAAGFIREACTSPAGTTAAN